MEQQGRCRKEVRKLPLCHSPRALTPLPAMAFLALPSFSTSALAPGPAGLSEAVALESPLVPLPLSSAQVMLRVKENELQYLKKEVQCLREELQMMQKVGVFWEPLGEQQEREERGAPGLVCQQGSAGLDGMLGPNPLVTCAPHPCSLLST